ncbi:MAG: tRNA pseudouridine(38-40) synthase TruA [Acidimicrobiia bacterium]
MTLFDPPEQTGPLGPTTRIRLLVAYDGSGYHGFAAQPGLRTVAGALTAVVEHVVGHRVELTCAGRTDKGVHAWGQVVTFDARADRADPEALQRAVNRRCGPGIVVRGADVVPDDFDARHSARARTYRYTVLARPLPDPFLAGRVWHVPSPVELELLTLACDPFLGEHDFSSFCRRPKGRAEPASLVRRILSAGWTDLGDDLLRFEISANAFCHQMVRSIVGTIVAAGRGELRPGDLRGVLAARDRGAAGPVAPPEGLCLWAVDYGDGPGELRPVVAES